MLTHRYQLRLICIYHSSQKNFIRYYIPTLKVHLCMENYSFRLSLMIIDI